MDKQSTVNRLGKIIRGFTTSIGRECPGITWSSDLHKDVGLTSDDGVCIVLEISSEFGIEIPDDFNAVVHDDGKRARTLEELAECVMKFGA